MNEISEWEKVRHSGKEREAIDQLSQKIVYLSKVFDKNAEISNKLQRWLIFWTIVMAIAVFSQAVLIGIQLFGS